MASGKRQSKDAAEAAKGVANHSNQGSSRQVAIKRVTPIDSYEKALQDAREWARIIGFLHAVSQFLSFCNVTWATAVLLAAFTPSLARLDFAFVGCLLLLEGGRVASASFFMRLPMRPLAYGSQDPKKINHGEDGHYPRSHRTRISSYIIQAILVIPSLALPTIGHISLDYSPKLYNVQSSLRIFYSFVAFNSLVALLNLTCFACAFASLHKTPEESILRYFDTVLQNATSSGIVQADDFDFFCFAYTMLGAEFRRNVQPEAVAKNHKQLIQYLYAHRLGVDFLQIYMNADDAFVQLTAVNMVGFWADTVWGVGLGSEVKLPWQLITKLADKVGTGQVGWAANTCIGVLAGMPKWADRLAHTCTSSGLHLLDCLAATVDDSSSRSLSTVRTLARLYEALCVNELKPPRLFDEEWTNLVPKLRKLSKAAKVQRLRVQAAYLLLMMGEECERSVIMAIQPTQDSYWFRSEVRMLELLLDASDAPLFAYSTRFCIREDPAITPPPWAQIK